MPLPFAFAERMQQQLGSEYAAFEQALQTEAPISIRINTAKWQKTVNLESVPWASNAYYLPQRPLFTLDPLLHAGAYYVQEASSMFVEQAITQHLQTEEAVLALDLCGAPGGKSTHLSSVLPYGSLLVSNEVIRTRANILMENLQKWGTGYSIVTNNDPKDFQRLTGLFDVMLIDAPCSGEGLFRKDEAAIEEWSVANVKLCSERQRRILMDVWDALKPGGLLVYSTCTYSPQENEENLTWLAQEQKVESLALKLDPTWQVTEATVEGLFGYRFYPHKTRGEGFFMTVLRKLEGEEASGKRKKGKKSVLQPVGKNEKAAIQGYLLDPTDWDFFQEKEQVIALPKEWSEEIEILYEALRIVYGGVAVAEIKKKNVNPQHALALSLHIHKEVFQTVEVDLAMALRFLRKEDILPENAPDGWVLIQYQNMPLGWIKKMQHRANNYYPKEWRIRMEISNEQLENYQPVLQ